jgi:DNA polymerase III epsilon subunit-like protein
MKNISSFLESVTVLDTETTGLDTNTAEIVELGVGTVENSQWKFQSKFYKPSNPIPAEASAKHAITNRMVANCPKFDDKIDEVLNLIGAPTWFVAHNAVYDRSILVNSLKRAGQNDVSEIFNDPSMWICTMRVAKKIYANVLTDNMWSLQYLRYKLDLPIDDAVGGHSATDDVTTCAILLQRLVDDGIEFGLIDPSDYVGNQLNKLTVDPFFVSEWPIGKYKGVKLSDIPLDYFLWAIDNVSSLNESNPSYDYDLTESVKLELQSRL